MLSLITAIYVILNPVITGANVTADSALVIMFAKFYKKFFVKGKQVSFKVNIICLNATFLVDRFKKYCFIPTLLLN